MKKKLFLVMVIALSLCLLFCACKGIDNELEIKFPQSFDPSDATDLDAVELYNEALENFAKQDNYLRTQYYSFESSWFDMQIKTIRKINGDKIYNEEVVIGKGVMSLNEGKKVYFDGNNAYSLYFNDDSVVPGDGEDIFAVSKWSDLGAYDAERYGDAAETKLSYKESLLAYNVSGKEALAADCDTTVYEVDGVYYFTLEIDCSEEAMKTMQAAVAQNIAEKTGGSADDLKMISNTIIKVAVIVDEQEGAKFALIETQEQFDGKISIFTAKDCKQTYSMTFDYGDAAAITQDDIKGVA